jgi:hypothetical protein
MRKVVLLIALLGVFSLLAVAEDTPKAEVFGGYQYTHVSINTSNVDASGNLNGWNASLAGNINKTFGIAGDFSGDYGKIEGVTTHVYTYAGGPVVNLNHDGKVNPFVHALFGGARLNLSASLGGPGTASLTFNGFTVIAGGGVDVKVSPRVAVRLVQADWVYLHFGDTFKSLVGESSLSKNVRVSTGIVFRF